MGEIMSKINIFLDITSKVPVAAICCVIAGIVVALVFIIAFFLELFIPKKNEKEEEEDVEELLNRLDSATASQEKSNEVEQTKNYDELFAKLEEEINESKKQREEQEKKSVESKNESNVVENTTTTTTVTTEITNKVVGPEFDYYQRLDTINASLAKLDKDLQKSTREVNKYEKTEKRKARNEKLLDKKATELTNLNLVLYNVNDIKDIDPEKKERQQDLTEHIAELKNSVNEANEYLDKNKEKYENSKKIKTFLEGEKQRYEAEIIELNALIAESKKKNNQ